MSIIFRVITMGINAPRSKAWMVLMSMRRYEASCGCVQPFVLRQNVRSWPLEMIFMGRVWHGK
jgi:hypothetical protein